MFVRINVEKDAGALELSEVEGKIEIGSIFKFLVEMDNKICQHYKTKHFFIQNTDTLTKLEYKIKIYRYKK